MLGVFEDLQLHGPVGLVVAAEVNDYVESLAGGVVEDVKDSGFVSAYGEALENEEVGVGFDFVDEEFGLGFGVAAEAYANVEGGGFVGVGELDGNDEGYGCDDEKENGCDDYVEAFQVRVVSPVEDWLGLVRFWWVVCCLN